MATIYNMAGTTSHSFKLGDGTTIFYGSTNPSSDMGKIGDIYIQMNKDIYDADVIDESADFATFPSTWESAHGTPLDIGHLVKYSGETESSYIKNYYYSWNGTSWDEAFSGELGRIWYKEYFNDTSNNKTSRWSFIKTYSFDNDIIHAIETGTFSNDFRISLESADNSSIISSTKQNDYTKNHSAYGVTRFAVTNETYAGNSGVDKFIVETPAQIKADINVEKTRAEGAEQHLQDQIGNLSQLTTPVTTNLVASDNSLQAQIDTIVSKSDVVDIVAVYDNTISQDVDGLTDLIHYNTEHLGDMDVIKVLQDNTNNDATTYYRFTPVPTTPTVSVATHAALEAYPTTSLTNGNVAKVTDDSPVHTGEAYYVWRKLGNSYDWNYSGPCVTTVHHDPDKHYWDRIGEEGPFYTKSEADGRFVHLTGAETIEGTKTFQNQNLIIKSKTLDSTSTTTTDYLHLAYQDKNGREISHLKTILENGTIRTQMSVTGDNAQTFESIEVKLDTTSGTVTTRAPAPTDTTSTSSNQIATVGWVNTVGNKVVHLSGNEEISGTKTFTGTITATSATVTVATQQKSDSSTKAASTAFVHNLVDTSLLPTYDSSTAGKYLSVDNNGSTVWASINNVPLGDLSDVYLTNETPEQKDGQVLIYDKTLNSNAGGWKNGYQVTATIKYW